MAGIRRANTIYMTDGEGPDDAILRGLYGAGCEVAETRGITATVEALKSLPEGASLLVAEVQAGAIPLLALMRERRMALPPTLLLDHTGTDIHAPIKALEFGVRAYVLACQPPIERETLAQLTAERALNLPDLDLETAASYATPHPSQAAQAITSPAELAPGFDWDPIAYVLRVAGKYTHLSAIEGRIFDLLLRHQGRTVTLREFMRHALRDSTVTEKTALEQLRPHIMRLRRKLALAHPPLAERVVNTRGSGYMLV